MSLEGKRLSLFHGTNSQSLIDFSLLKNDKKQEAFCQFRDLSGLVLDDTSGDFIVHLQSEVVRQSKFAFVQISFTSGPGVSISDPHDDFVLSPTLGSQGSQVQFALNGCNIALHSLIQMVISRIGINQEVK